MSALSVELQQQSEELDQKLGAKINMGVSTVVKQTKTKQTHKQRSVKKITVTSESSGEVTQSAVSKRKIIGNEPQITKKSKNNAAPTPEESDDEPTKSDNSCKVNHNDMLGNFTKEGDARYFKDGAEVRSKV